MVDYIVTDTELTSVANAIRTKGGTSALLSFPTEFIAAINAISGGGEDGDNLSYGDRVSPIAGLAQTGYAVL